LSALLLAASGLCHDNNVWRATSVVALASLLGGVVEANVATERACHTFLEIAIGYDEVQGIRSLISSNDTHSTFLFKYVFVLINIGFCNCCYFCL
jgi:hypothetical protein